MVVPTDKMATKTTLKVAVVTEQDHNERRRQEALQSLGYVRDSKVFMDEEARALARQHSVASQRLSRDCRLNLSRFLSRPRSDPQQPTLVSNNTQEFPPAPHSISSSFKTCMPP